MDENFATHRDIPGVWRVTWTNHVIANIRATGFVAICWANDNIGSMDITVDHRDITYGARN